MVSYLHVEDALLIAALDPLSENSKVGVFGKERTCTVDPAFNSLMNWSEAGIAASKPFE